MKAAVPSLDIESKYERIISRARVASVYHPYSMPYQHFDVYLCRGLRWPLERIWPKLKHWN